ncbi:ribosomal RNA small subunit methyltransferase A [Candidatus Micrarchaeota archaeon]|nr:ribosomal RNA small subunit methyltransferase A [Candidatus Micrarchaeota archaeon]MBU1166554.1 ribosomal RNA small subunit methyltransferase A [Candidatus Micrarchaeota archaeon]MBU1887564.1 ribosomal RNA small subunit methyltransferase A [Candidatus Micrarchaeota archaeon]
MSKLSFDPIKRMGQCFLQDKNILELEAKLANPKHKTVLEIGPGDGRLTEVLLRHKPKKIFAVEKDYRFIHLLKKKFANAPVEIIEGDILKIKIPEVDIVIGNIPYYISSDIIFTIKDSNFEHAVLMVQKEFAQKMVAEKNKSNYGRLSVTSQIHFDIKLKHIVPRHLFVPIPQVDSAIIILKPTKASITQFDENVIRYIFQHKNQTVRNALLHSKFFEKYELDVLGKFAKRKGRTLSKTECLEISKLLSSV